MVATLKSVSLAEMNNFIAQRGTRHKFIRHNLVMLPKSLAGLAGLGQLRDNVILLWVEKMLSEEQNARPSASDLTYMIKLASSECLSSSFCGFYCMDPGEEDFSDYAGN